MGSPTSAVPDGSDNKRQQEAAGALQTNVDAQIRAANPSYLHDALRHRTPRSTASRRPRYSVVIPYYNRLPYLERTLKALADQELGSDLFEVVIASMECSEALARTIDNMPPHLRVRCIMTREPWNVSRARNLAFAHSEGEILVLLDADMLLPRSFLRTLDEQYRKEMYECVLVGQMLGYDCDEEVTEDHLLPYEYYRERHLASNCREGLNFDSRWTSKRKLPWSLCFSALMVISKTLIASHELFFDQTFKGWGGEDLEWGYRIHRSGISIVLADDLWGIHVPHSRDVRKNHFERDLNYARFLAKWPCFEVELVTCFGDPSANELADQHALTLDVVRDGQAVSLLEIDTGRGRCIVLGAIIGPDGAWLNRTNAPALSEARLIRPIPILGIRLPYRSQSLQAGYFLDPLRRAPESIQRLIRSELRRVCLETHFSGAGEVTGNGPVLTSVRARCR